MALQKTETYKGSEPFTGYWAMGPVIIDPFRKELRFQLGLFWDAATYNNNPQDVLTLSEEFIVDGETYDMFLPQGISPEEMPSLGTIMFNMFNFAKNYVNFDGTPGYFSDAEMVA